MKSQTFTGSSLAESEKAVTQWLAANEGRVKKIKQHPPVEMRTPSGRFQKKASGKVVSVSIRIEYED